VVRGSQPAEVMRLLSASVTVLVFLAACGKVGDTDNPVKPGQSDFVSIERDYYGDYATLGGSEKDSAGNAAPKRNVWRPAK